MIRIRMHRGGLQESMETMIKCVGMVEPQRKWKVWGLKMSKIVVSTRKVHHHNSITVFQGE